MLTQPTLDKLQQMRLFGMAKALEEQLSLPDVGQMSFEERFGLIVDREDCERRNRRYRNRLRQAKARDREACIEGLDFSKSRGFEKSTVLSMASCDWVDRHQNIIITGPTGVGKTYLACALLHAACKHGYRGKYLRVPRFLRGLSVAKLDGSYDKVLLELSRHDVVVFDDLGLSKLGPEESRDFLEVMEDRHGQRSSIFTSQLAPAKWYELITDPTVADAFLDRIIHRSHTFSLRGPSMRKERSDLTQEDK